MKTCKTCKQPLSPDLAPIERFLIDGVRRPPSRATKDEMDVWIEEACQLLSILRELCLRQAALNVVAGKATTPAPAHEEPIVFEPFSR